MNKQSQSLLDFINFFPLQSIVVRRSPLDNKEAKVLYKIFTDGDRDAHGQIVLPGDVDQTTISALTSKGMIESAHRGLGLNDYHRRIAITGKGKDVIRNIILYTEKSTLEDNPKKVDYESIHEAVNPTNVKNAYKVASNINRSTNWLQRICK